ALHALDRGRPFVLTMVRGVDKRANTLYPRMRPKLKYLSARPVAPHFRQSTKEHQDI
ncbi:hypothetical protein GGI09_008836, partial [Coemansia sp. S100]